MLDITDEEVQFTYRLLLGEDPLSDRLRERIMRRVTGHWSKRVVDQRLRLDDAMRAKAILEGMA